MRKLSFTGSTEVGRLLMQQVAPTIKKLSLELGGNAPFIVFDDADLDAAVEGAIISKYRNAGQTCVCANRLFVQDKVYDAFAAKLAAKVAALKVGRGTEAGVTQGPLIDAEALAKVEEHVADATRQGREGRRRAASATRSAARSSSRRVLTDVTPDMKIFREETFGPVAPLIRFKTDAEVIELANDTEFGLAAYFYSRDIGRVWRVAEALEYGHGRRQHRPHHDRGRAVRRRQAVGPRPRRLRSTASTSTSRSSTSASAASTASASRPPRRGAGDSREGGPDATLAGTLALRQGPGLVRLAVGPRHAR